MRPTCMLQHNCPKKETCMKSNLTLRSDYNVERDSPSGCLSRAGFRWRGFCWLSKYTCRYTVWVGTESRNLVGYSLDHGVLQWRWMGTWGQRQRGPSQIWPMWTFSKLAQIGDFVNIFLKCVLNADFLMAFEYHKRTFKNLTRFSNRVRM